MLDDPAVRSYWVVIHVRLREPLSVDDGTSVHGYYRAFGLRCDEAELRTVLAAEASDGTIDWNDSTRELREPADMSEDVRRKASPDDFIWYRSGRTFYSDDPN